MRSHLLRPSVAFALGTLMVVGVSAQQVTKKDIAGISTFAQVETTIGCGGSTKPEAIREIKRIGFKSVINLRLASEEGAQVEAEGAAVEAAGLHYVHLPFNMRSPDPKLIDNFIAAVTASRQHARLRPLCGRRPRGGSLDDQAGHRRRMGSGAGARRGECARPQRSLSTIRTRLPPLAPALEATSLVPVQLRGRTEAAPLRWTTCAWLANRERTLSLASVSEGGGSGGNRTHTPGDRREILSLLRLPVPPLSPRHVNVQYTSASRMSLRKS